MGKELGKRIAEELKKTGMTQKEFAARVGVKEDVMSRYISGDRDPKPETIANIATVLRTTSDYLLGIENDGSFNHIQVCRLLARNAPNMTEKEKKELIDALF